MVTMLPGSGSRTHSYAIDRNIFIATPPSIVADAIAHYVDERHGTTNLIVPVRIECEVHPNKAMIARYDDRVVVRLRTGDGTGPSFDGRFTIRPKSGGTELNLKGRCISRADYVVEAMIHLLLEELKSFIEAEFGGLRASN